MLFNFQPQPPRTDTSLAASPASQTTVGVAVTPGISNAQGSNGILELAIPFDIERLILNFHQTLGNLTNAADLSVLADVNIDPTGQALTWQPLIQNLMVGMKAPMASDRSSGMFYDIPCYIKAGTSIGVSMQSAHSVAMATTLPRVMSWGVEGQGRPGQDQPNNIFQSIGINRAASRGTPVTSGAANTFGSWTTLGTADRDYRVVIPMNGAKGSAGAVTASQFHVQFGVDGVPITPEMWFTSNATGFYTMMWPPVRFGPIKGGSTVQARLKAAAATQTMDFAVLGCT